MARSVEVVPLTALASRYSALKDEVAVEFKARQLASRFGGDPAARADGEPKRDARAEAARRLGVGVSHATLEKVAWLQHVVTDPDGWLPVKQAAFDALEAVDQGEGVDHVYTKVLAMSLIADIESVADDEATDPLARQVAAISLRKLRAMQEQRFRPEVVLREARKAAALVKEAQGQRR